MTVFSEPLKNRRRVLVAGSLLAAMGAGYAGFRLWETTNGDALNLDAGALGQLLDTDFSDVNDATIKLQSHLGKVLIVNFWATWCPPCRHEMPAFSKLQDKLDRNVQFFGIGIDSPSAIKEFALQFPVSYPLLIGGSAGMDLMRKLGNPNAALPYTLVLRSDGKPAFSHLGMLSEEMLSSRLAALIAEPR